MRRSAPAGSQRYATLGITLWVVAFAALADQTVRMVDPQTVPWITWAWVLGLSFIGWFASSAPKLASWADADDRLSKRLGVVQSAVVSQLAGFISYLLALYTGTPNLLAFVGVALAAYFGEKYLARVAQKQQAG